MFEVHAQIIPECSSKVVFFNVFPRLAIEGYFVGRSVNYADNFIAVVVFVVVPIGIKRRLISIND